MKVEEGSTGFELSPEPSAPIIPPAESISERWRGTLKYAVGGSCLAIITGVSVTEVGLGTISAYLAISGQLTQQVGIQEILSDIVKSAQAGVIIGIAATPWFALTFGYIRYHSLNH